MLCSNARTKGAWFDVPRLLIFSMKGYYLLMECFLWVSPDSARGQQGVFLALCFRFLSAIRMQITHGVCVCVEREVCAFVDAFVCVLLDGRGRLRSR